MRLADLPPGTMHDCTVEGRDIVLCRTLDGTLYALDNLCTHAQARMCEGRLRGTRLLCPMHGGAFDVRDGRTLRAPATRALIQHEVRARGVDIEVRVAPPGESA